MVDVFLGNYFVRHHRRSQFSTIQIQLLNPLSLLLPLSGNRFTFQLDRASGTRFTSPAGTHNLALTIAEWIGV